MEEKLVGKSVVESKTPAKDKGEVFEFNEETTPHQLFEMMLAAQQLAKIEFTKLFDTDVKVSAVRLRKLMLFTKDAAHQMRKLASEFSKELVAKRKAKREEEVLTEEDNA